VFIVSTDLWLTNHNTVGRNYEFLLQIIMFIYDIQLRILNTNYNVHIHYIHLKQHEYSESLDLNFTVASR